MSVRYDRETAVVLFDICIKSRDERITEGYCLGCGLERGEWEEEIQQKRIYCRQECQKIYHDFYLPMGGKRLEDGDQYKNEKAVDFPQFLRLLELVDESTAPTIIEFAYPNYREDPSQMRAVLDLRGQSKQLKRLIETYLLKPVDVLDNDIVEQLTQLELFLFPNLTELTVPDKGINSIASLTRLEHLDISHARMIGDNSIRELGRLKTLILGDAPYIRNSLTTLTNLESLYILRENTTITNEIMSRLSTTLLQLSVPHNSQIRDSALSRLTNLTLLDIVGCENITDYGLLPLVKLQQLGCANCKNVVSHGLAKMRDLVIVVANGCPLFNGVGFAYNVPIETLFIENCPEFMDSPFTFSATLKSLSFKGTPISDRALYYATNIETLTIVNTPLVTDAALSRFTNLTSLVLYMDTPNITRQSFAKLKKLILLDIDLNDVEEEEEEEPLEFPSLLKLSLLETSTLRDQDLMRCTALEILNLEMNDYITGDVFPYLTNLRLLNLSHNSLIRSESLTGLVNLQQLVLIENDVIDGDVLSVLDNLNKITLYNGASSNDYRDINRITNAIKERMRAREGRGRD